MARFIKANQYGAYHSWYSVLAVLGLTMMVSLAATADDSSTLQQAPFQPPYKWFASTDPKGQNADYIPLKPGETRRIPLANGTLLRLWSTAFEPDKITLVLQNGSARTELLRANTAKFGELYEKGFTFYPTDATPAGVRQLEAGAALVATNNSPDENKWFYQVTIRDGATTARAQSTPSTSPAPQVRFDPSKLDEIMRPTALAGQKLFELPAGAGNGFQLCSAYGSARSQKGQPIPILKVQGAGVFVGLLLDIRPAPDTTRRTFAYLEGNEIIRADENTYEGTGTEDYFNSAWYYPEKPFTRQYHGMTFKGQEPPRVTTYRWMVRDAVPFRKNFQFDLEHGNGNNSNDLEYRWVAFWYQQAPLNFEIEDGLATASGQGAAQEAGDAASNNSPAVWILVALGGAAIALFIFGMRKRKP